MFQYANANANLMSNTGSAPEPEAHDKVLENSRSNLNMEMLVFEERGKPEDPEKNLSEQGREPTASSTHI